jgi:hypothetical protein
MPTLDSTIDNFVVGDDLKVDRTISNIPQDDTVVKAWFTVKRFSSQLDADALFQKSISTGYVQNQGQITDAGASGTASLFFELNAAVTSLLQAGVAYLFDIQVKTANGAIYTPESGTITGTAQITLATT